MFEKALEPLLLALKEPMKEHRALLVEIRDNVAAARASSERQEALFRELLAAVRGMG